ncbi:MAG: esterase [Lachnospiraceae bacterium]|nr:esterase [Lachnospiraceae bacterium]
MKTQYFCNYSPALNRQMECKVYGHAGRPVIFFPCQDGRFYDFENYHMTDVWAPWIESRQVMVCAVDTVDSETWSKPWEEAYGRIRWYEQWITYITDEVVPFLRTLANEYNGWEGYPGVMLFGCSLGATHAANLFFRRPDLFDGLLALSGLYSTEYGFGDYMDEIVYQNSPVHYLGGMPKDHPYIQLYNLKRAVICCGQGAWEMPEYTRNLKRILEDKGIHAWVDLWGTDCRHDWDWWYKQVVYFVPYLLGEDQVA